MFMDIYTNFRFRLLEITVGVVMALILVRWQIRTALNLTTRRPPP